MLQSSESSHMYTVEVKRVGNLSSLGATQLIQRNIVLIKPRHRTIMLKTGNLFTCNVYLNIKW